VICLLDANVLIALHDVEHIHHQQAVDWVESIDRFATDPIVEGALTRYLIRAGVSIKAVQIALAQLQSQPKHEFWEDSLPYSQVSLPLVIGHRQVTDAYLVALARHHGQEGRLATLDKGLAALYPDLTVLVAG